MKSKQELLDLIEQNTMSIAGEIVIAKTGLVRLQPDRIEEYLGEILDATLDLKQLEGIPSNLKRVDRDEP